MSVADTYFEPPSRMQLLEKLQHLIRYSDFLLLVTGESGSGKTTLINQLIPVSDDPNLVVCHLPLTASVKDRELLSELVLQLPQHEAGGNTLAEQLTEFQSQLKALSDAGQKCLILVDNADLLSDSALDLLLNLHAAGSPEQQVQLVLFAEVNFATRLAQNELIRHLEGRIHNLLLVGMKDDEVHAFMEICLPQSARLSMQKRDAIVQRSGGMPGRVIELLSANMESPASRLFPLPPLHMAGIAVMLLVVLVLSMWQFMPQEQQVVSADSQERIAVPLTVQVVPVEDQVPAEVATLPLTEAPVNDVEPQQIENQVTQVVVPEHSEQIDKEPEITQPPSESVIEKPEIQTSVVESSTPVQPVAEVTAAAAPVETPEVVVTSVPQPESRYSQDEQTLLGWPAKSYTLQVMGSRSEEGAQKFIQSQSSAVDFYYFATQYKGKPWYVVVYGQYSNRDAATSAIQQLPAALQKVRPWARSLQSVQLDIKKKTN
ncbi:AAA family ATPase [Neptuniibacter sp. CAU 1671]|uniref:AAA family ATPase n=1 Tax=Neptuniibacter sp. CAU 1671 TaxID=3032593 RepID=UPI0023DB091E|nr:AAA family ATPase [Neptuniibacter sp. CAU 1671]MDF2181661.1 AAA family ATPase [Neptuniibacter sp. CAU 1671]